MWIRVVEFETMSPSYVDGNFLVGCGGVFSAESMALNGRSIDL